MTGKKTPVVAHQDYMSSLKKTLVGSYTPPPPSDPVTFEFSMPTIPTSSELGLGYPGYTTSYTTQAPKPWGVPSKSKIKPKPISTPIVMTDTHVVCAKCGLSGGGSLCCVNYSVTVKKSTIRYDEAGKVIRAVACRQAVYT